MATFTVYEAQDGWRWRLTANNGRIIADCGEAYESERNAVRAARRTKELAPGAPVRGVDGTRLDESRAGSTADVF